MIRRPPRSTRTDTLFPYTTLFRSDQGITLFPQDGSGITSPDQILVTSAAVEESIPDVQAGRRLGLRHLTRPQLLAELVNAAPTSIAVGGTSGKSTVTGLRSEERRVGKAGVSTCRVRVLPDT